MKALTTPNSALTATPLLPKIANTSVLKSNTNEAGFAHDPKNWVPLKEAAYLLLVSRRTIVRMCETADPKTGRAYLRGWRPTPRILMICRRSLQQFCPLTQSDPDFWQNRGREMMPLSAAAVMKPARRTRRR